MCINLYIVTYQSSIYVNGFVYLELQVRLMSLLQNFECVCVVISDKNLQCHVCMEDFQLEELVRSLPCHHIYHGDCIVPWLELVSLKIFYCSFYYIHFFICLCFCCFSAAPFYVAWKQDTIGLLSLIYSAVCTPALVSLILNTN